MPSLTQEQITQARETDLLDYLLSHESGVLKREGANYRHREHDSLVYVASKNYWYWNSRGRKINAVDYLMEIRGYSFVDAVERLAGCGTPAVSHYDLVWSDKVGYVWLAISIDPVYIDTGNWIRPLNTLKIT